MRSSGNGPAAFESCGPRLSKSPPALLTAWHAVTFRRTAAQSPRFARRKPLLCKVFRGIPFHSRRALPLELPLPDPAVFAYPARFSTGNGPAAFEKLRAHCLFVSFPFTARPGATQDGPGRRVPKDGAGLAPAQCDLPAAVFGHTDLREATPPPPDPPPRRVRRTYGRCRSPPPAPSRRWRARRRTSR